MNELVRLKAKLRGMYVDDINGVALTLRFDGSDSDCSIFVPKPAAVGLKLGDQIEIAVTVQP